MLFVMTSFKSGSMHHDNVCCYLGVHYKYGRDGKSWFYVGRSRKNCQVSLTYGWITFTFLSSIVKQRILKTIWEKNIKWPVVLKFIVLSIHYRSATIHSTCVVNHTFWIVSWKRYVAVRISVKNVNTLTNTDPHFRRGKITYIILRLSCPVRRWT